MTTKVYLAALLYPLLWAGPVKWILIGIVVGIAIFIALALRFFRNPDNYR